MRELTYEEMEQVDGGVAPAAIAVGLSAAYGAYSGYRTAGVGGALAGAAMGAVAGMYGVAAATYSGLARVVYGGLSIAHHMAGEEMVDLHARTINHTSS